MPVRGHNSCNGHHVGGEMQQIPLVPFSRLVRKVTIALIT